MPRAPASLSVPELAAASARHDQRHVTICGIARFTSHGIWLVPRCAGPDDVQRVVVIQRPDIAAMANDDAFGHLVELTGTFRAGVENAFQSYHTLVNARYVGRIAESSCPE